MYNHISFRAVANYSLYFFMYSISLFIHPVHCYRHIPRLVNSQLTPLWPTLISNSSEMQHKLAWPSSLCLHSSVWIQTVDIDFAWHPPPTRDQWSSDTARVVCYLSADVTLLRLHSNPSRVEGQKWNALGGGLKASHGGWCTAQCLHRLNSR